MRESLSLSRPDNESATRIVALSDWRSLEFAAFTFPAFRKYLGGIEGMAAVYIGAETGATNAPAAAGLAMAVLGDDLFEILSLHTGPDDPGYATREALLREVSARCAALGVPKGIFNAGYEHGDDRLPAMLSRSGWRGPHVTQLSITSTCDMMLRLPFLIEHGQPRAGTSIVPWHGLDEPARARLAARLNALPAQIRREIDPFAGEARAWRELSFALLRHGEIVGWHLPEFFDLYTVRWTISVSMPGHNSMATVLQLWLHALRAQKALGAPNLIFACHAMHPHMMRFMLRRLPPAAISLRTHATFGYDRSV